MGATFPWQLSYPPTLLSDALGTQRSSVLEALLPPAPAPNNYLLPFLQQPPTLLGGLADPINPFATNTSQLPSNKWAYTANRFTKFLTKINPTDNQIEDCKKKIVGISQSLDRNYWPNKQQGDITSLLIGSWDKRTNVRMSSDIDLIYLLPWEVRDRFSLRGGNIQSQILQEVKIALLCTFCNTEINGDGPAVVANFSTYKVEIIPAFIRSDSPRFIDDLKFMVDVCHTKNGGYFTSFAPVAERQQINENNLRFNNNLVSLIRMAKIWKYNCNVPITSITLEQMAISFLAHSRYAKNGYLWYDWIVRDFFEFMLNYQNSWALLPGSNQKILCGDEWASKAKTAYQTSLRACESESNNNDLMATEEWQKIFGNFISREV